MSIRVGSGSLISGAVVVGNPGLGVLGSTVPSTGDNGSSILYNDLSLPADASKEVRANITTWPSSGTLFVYEDGSFEYSGSSDTFAYQLYVDGVAVGSPVQVTLSLGATTKVYTAPGVSVAATVTVYVGGTWVTGVLKVWNGSAWV